MQTSDLGSMEQTDCKNPPFYAKETHRYILLSTTNPLTKIPTPLNRSKCPLVTNNIPRNMPKRELGPQILTNMEVTKAGLPKHKISQSSLS